MFTEGVDFIPSFLLKPILYAASYLNVSLGMEIPQFGLEKDSVGHYVVSNIGVMGL